MAVIQRPLKGSRISSFYPVKTLPPITSLDSAFQLQEYISLLIRSDVHDVETIVSIPGRQPSPEREGGDGTNEDDKDGEKEGKSEVTVDEACWIYEQLRRLAQDLTHPLITTLQQECTRATCPEMKAGEWLYLCVAHGNEGAMEQCCAIDYILHTLDSATALLNSPRAFPSRLSIPPTSIRHFPSLARRLGRIFAHAYYHHREAFEQAEAESSLYARFLALTSKFNLVPPEFIMIPPRIGTMEEELEREEQSSHDIRGSPETESQQQEARQWTLKDSSSVVNLTIGRSSPAADIAGIGRNPSPRRMGRSRTDTMVFSEAANVAEELARSDSFTEADLDRAIAEERMLAAVAQPLPEAFAAPKPVHLEPEAELEPKVDESAQIQSEPETEPELEHESPAPAVEEELTALPGLSEVVLDIAAPAPAEPAIPTDVDEEEDITEDSTAEHTEAGEPIVEDPPAQSAEAHVDNAGEHTETTVESHAENTVGPNPTEPEHAEVAADMEEKPVEPQVEQHGVPEPEDLVGHAAEDEATPEEKAEGRQGLSHVPEDVIDTEVESAVVGEKKDAEEATTEESS